MSLGAGLALMPCRHRVAAACVDGFVRILELRMGGEVAAEADMGAGALACVVANGCGGVLAGGKDGRLVAWNPDAVNGEGSPHNSKPFGVAGVVAPPGGGVSCLAVAPGGGAVVVGWTDGSLGVFVDDADDDRAGG